MNNMDEKEDTIDPDLVKSILSSGSFGSFGFSPAFGLLGAMLMSKKKTNEMKTDIEIPFGAKDSELKGWEYTIPEGMEAIVKDGKVIVKEKESEDERIRQTLFDYFSKYSHICMWGNFTRDQIVAYLERLKENHNEDEFREGYLIGFEDGQTSQKPVEWSEEDKRILNELLDHCNTKNATWYNFLKSLPEKIR